MDDHDNILPWPIDHDRRPRYVRPMRPSHIARHVGDPEEMVDLYETLEERERIAKIVRDIRQEDANRKLAFWFGVAAGILVLMFLL